MAGPKFRRLINLLCSFTEQMKGFSKEQRTRVLIGICRMIKKRRSERSKKNGQS